MKHLVVNLKQTLFVISFTVFSLSLTGCAQDVPEVEEVDLTQAQNLFEQPLLPNPLALNNEDVVVIVNGEEITHGEIMQGVQMNMMRLSGQVPQDQLAQLAGQIYQNVQDTLIANILLTDAAGKSGLVVSNEDLEKEIEEIKAGAPPGSTLEEALAQNQINYDDWKEDLREQLLVQKLVEEKTAQVESATADEIAAFYQENLSAFQVPENVTASHILLAFEETDTEEIKTEKKSRLASLREKIVSGETPFEQAASEHSDCPSKQNGGNLGAFGRGQMVPEFESVAFKTEPGSISEIVETQFGYHLIKVTDRQPASTRSLDDIKEQLQEYLTSQKRQEALLAYISDLRSTADIQKKQNLE